MTQPSGARHQRQIQSFGSNPSTDHTYRRPCRERHGRGSSRQEAGVGHRRAKPGGRRPARRTAAEESPAIATNFTEDHRHALEALTRGEHDNLALFSCFINDAPDTTIVAINPSPPAEGPTKTEHRVTPLWVSVTDTMVLTEHDGDRT